MSHFPGLSDGWEIADGIDSDERARSAAILSMVVAGRMSMVSAAHVLDLSERQVRRLLERIVTVGAASSRHKAMGRPSNNRISDGVRDYAMTVVRECYADFGPTLATGKLAERDGFHVSREPLPNWW
jgi:DNA-binding CsgD family transcriptional regulator